VRPLARNSSTAGTPRYPAPPETNVDGVTATRKIDASRGRALPHV
jgi:hypothetical protein